MSVPGILVNLSKNAFRASSKNWSKQSSIRNLANHVDMNSSANNSPTDSSIPLTPAKYEDQWQKSKKNKENVVAKPKNNPSLAQLLNLYARFLTYQKQGKVPHINTQTHTPKPTVNQELLQLLNLEKEQPEKFKKMINWIENTVNSISFPGETLADQMIKKDVSILQTSKFAKALATQHSRLITKYQRSFSSEEQLKALLSADKIFQRADEIDSKSGGEGVRSRILGSAVTTQAVAALTGSTQIGLAAATTFQLAFYTKLKRLWNSFLSVLHYYPGSYPNAGPVPASPDLFLQFLFGIKEIKKRKNDDWVLNGSNDIVYIKNGEIFRSDGFPYKKLRELRRLCIQYLTLTNPDEQVFQEKFTKGIKQFRDTFKPVGEADTASVLRERKRKQLSTKIHREKAKVIRDS